MVATDSVVVVSPDAPPPAPKTEAKPKAPERPAWLPEKFSDPAQLAEAYSELEKRLGTQPAPKPSPSPAPVVDSANPLAQFEKEFSEKGALSPESYTALEQKGYPKALVDNYIAGQVAKASVEEQRVYAAVGGKEQYAAITAWAAENLSEEEIVATNELLVGGGVKAAQAAKALLHSYSQATGGQSSPKLLNTTPTLLGSDTYENVHQMMKDMSSDDYKFDSAFRERVKAKVARSTKVL